MAKADPCGQNDQPDPPDHLAWRGRVFDVDSVTPVDKEPDGSELLEVWVTERGDDDG